MYDTLFRELCREIAFYDGVAESCRYETCVTLCCVRARCMIQIRGTRMIVLSMQCIEKGVRYIVCHG